MFKKLISERGRKGALKNSFGFTLVELLVVISIIGVLSGVILANLNTTRSKSRDAKRVSDIKNIQIALEVYFDVNRKFPGTLAGLVPTYIPNIPVPPNGGSYAYVPLNSTCNDYHLGAALELTTNIGLIDDRDASGGTVASPAGSACMTAVTATSDFNGTGVACDGTGAAAQPGGGATGEKCFDVSS
jgi:prepilin-type N-terminal cleavage/methylation domain-containing protein